MTGLLLGLSSAICFASASICFKIGQRTHASDNGLFLSIFVNVVLLGTVSSFLTWPPWTWSGVAALLVGGVIGTVGGRSSNLKAIRAIGPSRANAFLTANPLVAAIVGWFVLDERLGPQEATGGALVIGGLLWLVRARSAPRTDDGRPPPRSGYLWAAAAPTFFGLAFVVRKWGIEQFPSPVVGAFIGAVAALGVTSAIDAGGGRLRETLRTNLGRISWWYLAAGVFTTLALLSQFTAFEYLPAWVVGILQGTQGIWTLLLGWIFLRQEEHIDRTLVTTIAVVAIGVTLIGLEI